MKTLISMTLTLLLAACGGGGGNGTNIVTPAPTSPASAPTQFGNGTFGSVKFSQ